jgi:hypothetical protein
MELTEQAKKNLDKLLRTLIWKYVPYNIKMSK